MKRIIIFLFGILFTGMLYANSTTRKAANKYISEKGLSIIARSSNYTLTSDKEGIFFLLSEDSFNDKVDIYIEIEQVTRDDVSKTISNASGANKVIESNNYIVINAWQFIGDWYFVKTPKGNFYNVSYKIDSITALLDDF